MKITAEHLARGAYVYVRQSTPDQLVNDAVGAVEDAVVMRNKQRGCSGPC